MSDLISRPSAFETARDLFRRKEWIACSEAIETALKQADLRQGEAVSLHVMQLQVVGQRLRQPQKALAVLNEARNLRQTDDPRLIRVTTRLQRDLAQDSRAFATWKRLLRSDRRELADEAAATLLNILVERCRFKAAAKLAVALRDRIGQSPSLDSDITTCALLEGDHATAARIVAKAKERSELATRFQRLEVITDSLRAETQAGNTMEGLRHIAIAGVSFVGSTTFGVILGSMPGWAFAGETHWLTNARSSSSSGDGKLSIKDCDEKLWPANCRVCGRRCEVFTNEYRRKLADDETGWYAKIAAHIGTRNIVTSDKNVHNFWQRDPLFRFDMALLFKTPEQQARSMLKQSLRTLPMDAAVADVASNLDAALDRWASAYLGHLKLLRPNRRAVIQWEQFVGNPEPHLVRLATLLDIPLADDVLERITLGHFIGGNTGVDIASISATGRLGLRRSNAPELPDELKARVVASKRAAFVHDLLRNEYERQFLN